MDMQSMHVWSVVLAGIGTPLFALSYFLVMLSRDEGKGMELAGFIGMAAGCIIVIPAIILYAVSSQMSFFLLLLLLPVWLLVAMTVIHLKFGPTARQKTA